MAIRQAVGAGLRLAIFAVADGVVRPGHRYNTLVTG